MNSKQNEGGNKKQKLMKCKPNIQQRTLTLTKPKPWSFEKARKLNIN